MSLQLQCFDSSTAAALALAGAVAADLDHAPQQQNHALLLVSGGRSPFIFFQHCRGSRSRGTTLLSHWSTSAVCRSRMTIRTVRWCVAIF